MGLVACALAGCGPEPRLIDLRQCRSVALGQGISDAQMPQAVHSCMLGRGYRYRQGHPICDGPDGPKFGACYLEP